MKEGRVKKLLLGFMGAALLASSTSHAAGINLSWNDCGAAGTPTLSFACNVNTGAPASLVASFVPPAGVPEFLGISAQVDITAGTTLPDWWKHGSGPGDCRGVTGLSTSFDFTSGPFTCTDFYSGQAAGGNAYDSGFQTANRARLRIQCAVPVDNRGAVDPSTEYYAFKVNISRSKTIGGGSCAGCTQEACIVFNSIQLFQPLELANDPVIDVAKDRNYVTWQSAAILDCPASTGARTTTWGKLKSLYR
jgi:hypothetical protein